MTDLSVVIPARNEMFLKRTVEDVLTNMRGDTEIIAILDGCWADPPLESHPKVTILHFPESIGQRAATNAGVSISTAKYIVKQDAHCAWDEGLDIKMMEVMRDNWTMAPIMRNLHVFNWHCNSCGNETYQGPTPKTCEKCSGTSFEKNVIWYPKPSPQSRSYCFDPTPHFQYFGQFNKRPEGQGDITPSMSLQGSFFMITRDKYWKLNVCDENFGSWGSQGIEVAVKTWLSGGQVMINNKTWYAHLFRTQGGDFGFPYHLSGSQVEHAKQTARELFFENKWDQQIYPLSWLVRKFWPVSHWTDEDLKALEENEKNGQRFTSGSIRENKLETLEPSPMVIVPIAPSNPSTTPDSLLVTASHSKNAGIVYYTDNQLEPIIASACQRQLLRSAGNIPIISVSLKPIDFGKNIVLPLERGYLTMFKQILIGLEILDTEYVFFCEHDVLYHPSHFEFEPTESIKYYYNENVWKVNFATGHALHYDCKQTSGLCAKRELLLQQYKERVKRTEEKFKSLGNCREFRDWIRRQGFEPGTHGRSERVDDYKSESWFSEYPNLDIRHNTNLTPSRWKQEEFRDKRNCRNWQESEGIPGWYKPGEFSKLLER